MPSPKPAPPDDPSPGPATPATSHRSSNSAGAKKTTPAAAAHHDAAASADNNHDNNNNNNTTPTSSNGRRPPANANRQRSQTMKPAGAQPSLLSDFLLGRQTPARVAAARRKSLDAAAVRAELRQEMRQAAVRKVQQPGGVRDRVKAWQRTNAAAMARGDPEAAPTEPTEVGAQVGDGTEEEDRLRIRASGRQKAKRRSAPQIDQVRVEVADEEESDEGGADEHAGGDAGAAGEEDPSPKYGPKAKPLPKARIVSDEHWMKKRRKSPPRAPPPKAKPEGSPIPKGFLQRTAQNPTVQNKIKDWALRVEPPESPKVKRYSTKHGDTVTVEEDAESGHKSNDEGLRVKPTRKKRSSDRSAEEAKPSPSSKSAKTYEDDGIRVTPSSSSLPDDGIRVTPSKSTLPDDGIRVTPSKSTLPDDGIRVRPGPKSNHEDASSARKSATGRSSRAPSTERERSPSTRIEVIEDPESTVDTPTRKQKSRRSPKPKRGQPPPSATEPQTEDITEITTKVEEDTASLGEHSSAAGSYEPSTVLGKSLAEIPFGYSAFSELDLPGSKRPKPQQRNPSLKAVPKVLKKVMSEGKKIIHDQVNPPKPVVNQPPSIESWLSGTVDPFVDAPAPRKNSVEEDWKHEARRRSTSGPREKEKEKPHEVKETKAKQEEVKETKAKHEMPRSPKVEEVEDQENITPEKTAETVQTPTKTEVIPTTPKSSGLKRSMATRSAASPLKSGPKKPFREVLKEAFRGESGGHKFTPATYTAVQEERVAEYDDDDESERYDAPRHRSSGGSRGRSPSPDPTLSTLTESTFTESTLTKSTGDSASSLPAAYPKRRPPTNGVHELSTIMSEQSATTHESDTMSTVSQTTITQSTALTPTDLSRRRSNKSGLKRRLTKHSDLVSVLSLPDDSQLPARTKSIRVARSLRRKTSKLDHATLDDLLREFTEDEYIYSRELKTLVDGVVPVLLTQFAHDGPSRPADHDDALSKAVVSMGIALEKLRHFHKRVPLHDAQALLAWLESVYPVYDDYLDVWRLGFQDLIVNLAPASGRPDDEDSLVNALPRNEDGDVIDGNGERVDVAHLLKRPLVRIKWMLKFAKGARLILGGFIDGEIVAKLETLQDKARRRHREEMARKADEDAHNTDTTRARDLRNLAPIGSVIIDRSRQVYAKDWFSLSLQHSSGQRLECQVELVFRDKAEDRRDPGDVLIRETGDNGRSWLLFPPVPAGQISARTGQGSRSLVVMVRGSHNMVDWYELFVLTSDTEEAVTEWVEILGSVPAPPELKAPAPTAVVKVQELPSPDDAASIDIPLGEREVSRGSIPRSPLRRSFSPERSPGPEEKKTPKTPARYHQRRQSRPTTPTTTSDPAYDTSPDRTPTQSSYHQTSPRNGSRHASSDSSSRPLREDMRPDADKLAKSSSPNSTHYREDGAPPPPAHRVVTPKKKSSLSPPVDLTPSANARVKRRTSSPLKHEYHPSDVSSEESFSSEESSGSESDGYSSDELEEDDIPDTLPGISIKHADPSPAESIISENSITPSNSASQAGVNRPGTAESEYTIKCVALTSYWSSRKGIWKDINPEPCSIVITPGLLEAFPLNAEHSVRNSVNLQASGTSDVAAKDNNNNDADAGATARPLIALDLTPVVMIRQSTVVDLEIRSPVRSYSKLNKIESSIFRFRTPSASEMGSLYVAVHQSRLNNAKFKALEEEARFRSFGQSPPAGAALSADQQSGGDDTSSRRQRRSWFGRKNSYRASTRAPSQSQGSSSTGVSASSFLKRLTGGGNSSFNIDKSSLVDRQSRAFDMGGTTSGGGGGGASLYTSGSSSASGGTPPRSPSVSLAEGSTRGLQALGSDNLKIRCHLAVSASKWEDQGNCRLQITRPPPGMRQELNLYHGMEKRVIVTSIPKKDGEKALVVLDVVLGSRCFGRLGARGIVLNVWEDLRDENNMVGMAPKAGALSGKVKKWCFQCSSAREASWILALVAQEVMIA